MNQRLPRFALPKAIAAAGAIALGVGPAFAAPAVYFDYDLDRGRDVFTNTVTSITGTPELWTFNFTDSNIALGGGVFSVTGDQGASFGAGLRRRFHA